MITKNEIKILKKDFIKKYWKDPVWSSVISMVIFAILSSLFTLIYIGMVSLYKNVPFKSIALQVKQYFFQKNEVNNFILWVVSIIILINIIKFVRSITQKIKSKKANTKEVDSEEEPPRLGEHSTSFFSSRLSGAFPGQRGFKWYEGKTAIQRLEIFLKSPLRFNAIKETGAVGDPIWWFRAGRSMYINSFKKLTKTKILLGIDELEIKKIGVFISEFYYKSFIYIETKGEKQTGLYNYSNEDIERRIESFGFCSEEFALLGKKPISREHYDDGATLIDGKVVEAFDSKLRVRYLSDYNFIIAPKQSPYNSRKFDIESSEYFNSILKGEKTVEEFVDKLKTYDRKSYI